MALGQLKISIPLIQETLGVPSYNLMIMATYAQQGGNGSSLIGYNSAFRIYETRTLNGGIADGRLLEGSRPMWNMWSKYIPGEWFPINGKLELRLRNWPVNPLGEYIVRIDDFRGYDPDALKPEISAPSTFYKPLGNANISFQIRLHQVQMESTHVLVEVTIGAQTKTVLIPKTDVEEGAVITHYDVPFTGVSTQSGGTIRVYGCNDGGTDLVDLQNLFGIFSFELVQNPYIEITTYVDAYNRLSVQASMYKGYGIDKVLWNNDFGVNIVITGTTEWYQTVNSSGNPTSQPVVVNPLCSPNPFTITIPQGFDTGFRMINIGDPSEIQGSNLYAAMKVTNVTPTPSDTTFTVTPSIASQYTY